MTEKVLPGSYEQAVAQAYTLFDNDMPAMQSWTNNSFSPKQLIKKINEKKISVLCVLGANTQSMFKEIHEQLLLKWLQPTSSSTMYATLGASAGAFVGCGHQAFESLYVKPIVPLNSD
jgi:hypothetical protein